MYGMKRYLLTLAIATIAFTGSMAQKVYTTYLWHLQQPIYWPEKSQTNPNRYQYVKESQDIKSGGGNNYETATSHPTNKLDEIFSLDDRRTVYQQGAKNSLQTILSYGNAGVQVNYSGVLIENVNSLGAANQWGYSPTWADNYKTARNWTTSTGNPKMDIVGFSYHHVISPLVSERALAKEIKTHHYIYNQTFGTNPVEYSKGYWPAEGCFSERIIKVLVQEGFQWSVVANSHLARTLNDYPLHYGTNGCNIDPPNKADKVSTNGTNWFNGQIDGRGGEFAAPYCYQSHKAKYVDPATGTEYKIDVVPMCDLFSYKDGYSAQGTGEINTNVTAFSNTTHPSIMLFCHDGDNAWGGGSSYYQEAVPSFTAAAHNDANLEPSTIQQYLDEHPVPANDLVHVEDGGWVNAASDWGHPTFINWIWPLYDATTHEFNPNGWTEDVRNWGVITAVDNFACMAEDLAGGTDVADIVYPTATSSNAEKAWHFYLPTNASCYMYYGIAEDMEVKQTIAGNNAIEFAQLEINAHPGVDNTPPSVFAPQRWPYNPGSAGFGPTYGYQEFINPKDFTVWTFGFDVSGITTAVLKYRTDTGDEANALTDNINDTYAGGTGVSAWQSITMTKKAFPTGNVSGNPEVDFFVLPDAMADLYYAEIAASLSDTLVDYYVEMTDTKGNTTKSPIHHVWVGDQEGGGGSNEVWWEPEEPTLNDEITININLPEDVTSSTNSKIHWGIGTTPAENWTLPLEQYWAAGTVLFGGTGPAVQTPLSDPDNDGIFSITIGPMNGAQTVDHVNFTVFKNPSWLGQDFKIMINNNPNGNPTSSNSAISMLMNTTHTFSATNFTFTSGSGATFAGIKLVSVETAGDLDYNSTDVVAGTDYADVTKLKFTPANNATGVPYATFTFKIKDSNGNYSDATYTTTINVYNENPLGANASVTTMLNTNYTFKTSDFSFSGMGGATFAGIKLVSVETAGDLEYNAADVVAGTDYATVTNLIFKPATGASGLAYASFTFKVKDSNGHYSDATYTMTVNVIATIPAGVSWFPENPTSNEAVTVFVKDDQTLEDNASTSRLHWGVNDWQNPIAAYRPTGSVLYNGTGPAVQTPFDNPSDGLFTITFPAMNNTAQIVLVVDFTVFYGGSWIGTDYHIPITQTQSIETLSEDKITIAPNPMQNFSEITINTSEFRSYVLYLTDLNGRVIKTTAIGSAKNIRIARGNLEAGVYILRFYDEISQKSISRKIIIM